MATSSITANFYTDDPKAANAIHLACAEFASCDWFFAVDRGILKKIFAT